MLPTSRLGTIRISGSPATAEVMPLVAADALEIALSNPNGPSTTAPLNWPLFPIFTSSPASTLDAIAGLTNSTAESSAIFGFATPIACAKSITFSRMLTLSFSAGAMLTTASVTISGL
jgi:hypothetical protein